MFSKKESMKVKGIAILLLLFHHLFYNVQRVDESGIEFIYIKMELVQVAAVIARICVWLFVFVSAYGLTYQYIQDRGKNKCKFIFRRWISLMSTFWFIYPFVFALLCFAKSSPMEKYENNIFYLILDLFGWADFFGTPMLTGVWWYLCFGQILILFIPFVNVLCEKLGWSSFLVVFIIMQYLPDGIKSMNGGRYSNYFLVVVLAVLCCRNLVFDKILEKK